MGDWNILDAGVVIPVLTVQPIWGWAVSFANKRIENRSWPTDYRGPFWLHTAVDQRCSIYEDACVTIRANIRHRPELTIPSPGNLLTNSVLALCLLEGMAFSPYEVTQCEPWENVSERGVGKKRNQAWRISMLHRLQQPIRLNPLPGQRAPGRLGFWKLPEGTWDRMAPEVQNAARLALGFAYVKGKGDDQRTVQGVAAVR